ncbi:ATP-binding cassette domain-containing protein [Rhizobium lusitanum]|uniref:ATP-binding cassette domain-containing protein n=1 Tax=Rhizobium lusitanum TaxID=293958 RepID=A0A6L9U4G3_9HYPH|nr:ABC transporter ATP-binding protein [Rhizobium lusitanum]NEI70815.1 ATP-binding cassette domain-containing protein [Rhizobium lusitanum]
MSSDTVIAASGLSKCYHIYDNPRDRLKQMIVPRMRSLFGFGARNYFREFWALHDVSFTIKKGETVGIVGRNGSGKSTLLQMICGTLNPTAGEVSTVGRIGALLELGSGFNPEFTGRENVFLNASLLGLTDQQIKDRFDAILSFADIGDFIDQPVKTYSSGMYVRLAFAVIAHIDADLLVIDEALSVGDAFFTQKCMRFLHDFIKRGSIIFVSHDTAAVRGLCTRAIWLDKGAVVMDGQPKDVCNRYLEAYYSQDDATPTMNSTVSEGMESTREDAQMEAIIDGRLAFLNASNLRNDLQVFTFNPDSDSFGKKHAEIVNVTLRNRAGNPLSWVIGGEYVVVQVEAKIYEDLASPIIGFMFKDRLGQTLFGENTYLTTIDHRVSCPAGGKLVAEFAFRMPILPAGDYALGVAIADGNQNVHVQHHWIYDAMVIRSETSMVATGLVGVPMSNVSLRAEA